MIEEPPPLWRAVVGNTEPWRRGRIFLGVLALWQLGTQLLVLVSQLLAGNLEFFLGFALGAGLFWFSFYFIWIGVHWVRWLTGGSACLLGFAKIIWGLRDGSSLLVLDGSVSLITGAYLALAPAVYFFALRQKEEVRWKEALVVAAVFLLLFLSMGITIGSVQIYKIELEARARAFADRTFRHIFIEHDYEFLKAHATSRLMKAEGDTRLNWFMRESQFALGGAVRNLQPAHGRIGIRLLFRPALVVEGVMVAEADSSVGRAQLQANIGNGGSEWEIDSITWHIIAVTSPTP